MGLLTTLRQNIAAIFANGGPQSKRIGIYGPPNAGKCLAPDEEVLLADGTYRRIDTVYQDVAESVPPPADVSDATTETWLDCSAAGIEVPAIDRDLNVHPQSVTHVFRQRYDGPMFRVRTQRGRSVTVSPEHPFISRAGDEVRAVPARHLEKGRRVATLGSFRPVGTANQYGSMATDGGHVKSASGSSAISSPGHEAADRSVAGLLGFVIGGAHLDGDTFVIAAPTKPIRTQYARVARRCGVTVDDDTSTDPPTIRVARSSLRSVLADVGWARTDPGTQKVPEGILTATDAVVEAFLSGVFDGGDTTRTDYLEAGVRPIFESRSRELIDGIAILLLRFGITAAVRTDEQNTDVRYVLALDRDADRRRFETTFGESKAVDAIPPIPDVASAEFESERAEDVVWDTVETVERFDYDGFIYDLTVAEDHTFATRDGLVVHNTTLANRIARDWTGDAVGPESHIPHETRRARRKENVEIERNGKSVTIDIVDTPGVATKVDYEDFLEHDLDEEEAIRRSREATEGVAEAMHWLREDVDGVIYVLDAAEDPFTQVNTMLVGIIESRDLPVLIFANKIDLEEANVKRIQDAFPQHETVPLSALEGDNMEEVYGKIAEYFG